MLNGRGHAHDWDSRRRLYVRACERPIKLKLSRKKMQKIKLKAKWQGGTGGRARVGCQNGRRMLAVDAQQA